MSDAMPRRRTLVVELDGRGHRFYLVRVVVEAALARGDSVTLLTKDHPETREHLLVHLGHLLESVELQEVVDPTWSNVERTADAVGATTTVVPEADGYLAALLRRRGWRGPGGLSLLIMRAQVPRAGGLVRWALRNALKVVIMSLIALLPRVRFRVLRSPLWRGRSVWGPAYDPVGLTSTPEEVEKLRSDWTLHGDHYWFGVLGALTPNKNLPMVVAAVCRVAQQDRVALLVAGKMSEEVEADLPQLRMQLDRAGVETRIVNRVLHDVELDAALTAVDCLVLAYGHHGPSGTLGKAMAAGTRIVAAGSSVLRQDCDAAPDAAEWCRLEPAQLTQALLRAARAGSPAPASLSGEPEFANELLG
ncbi:MAG: glycosyltransferase [Actinomycetota bacterium]|nr:glycosyltransferase [Actinomycetota bacterium]